MESDYQSLFQVRLANYDDIPAIMNITREAFVKYQQMSGVENLAALEESYNDVKKYKSCIACIVGRRTCRQCESRGISG